MSVKRVMSACEVVFSACRKVSLAEIEVVAQQLFHREDVYYHKRYDDQFQLHVFYWVFL